MDSWSVGQLNALKKVGEIWMPSIPRHGPIHHGYGAPRLRETARAVVLYAAWLRDLRSASYGAIARELEFDATRGYDAAKKMAKRHVREGRALLHAEGVLPWRAWPAGELPPEWSTFPELHRQLRLWHAVGREAEEEIMRARKYCAQVALRGICAREGPPAFRVSPWRLTGAIWSRREGQDLRPAPRTYPSEEQDFMGLLRMLQVCIIHGTSTQ
jgi:hypothetical protein